MLGYTKVIIGAYLMSDNSSVDGRGFKTVRACEHWAKDRNTLLNAPVINGIAGIPICSVIYHRTFPPKGP
jgi:hypothetical protein